MTDQMRVGPREITAKRIVIWEAYHASFEDLENKGLLRRPVVLDHCSQNAHMYYVLLETGHDRVRFIQRLSDADVNQSLSTSRSIPLLQGQYGRVRGSLGIAADHVAYVAEALADGLSTRTDGLSHHESPSGINKVAAAEADPSSRF
jgi:dTDP-4-amino-4,6-dideoxygalactose transaminase